ncbi:hypothetical protein DACRYDRAFT_94712 [Dacryopinax primogenitus]|uniref:PWI domain-containing protein n=1 Tax=Dacryopinax primogenitus (strain DJM 731) TaxID=1858805 RepID=M5G931_DACPD|nr:uncharacterized protein DACRYDRAFT_94712 [Dacryopinax primogenitus]EJU02382.1 hypothetical protein DACRYDRAFT_94712 [Dacryopinax primogenitus]
MDSTFFKGTSTEQDRRFSDKELRLLKTLKFPPEFDKKVELKKVNMSVMRPWITKKVSDLLGFEDEVVIEYAMGLLDDPNVTTPDPRKMQINLTGFLESKTAEFMLALWKLLLSAQESIAGIPAEFLEAKKAELRERQLTDSRPLGEIDRSATDQPRPSRFDDRGDTRGRGRGRGRGGYAGGRNDIGGREGGRERDSGWGARARGRGGYGGRSDRPRHDDRDRDAPSSFRRRSPDARDRSPPRRRSPSPRRRSPSESPARRRRSPSVTPPRRRRSPSTSPPSRRRRSPSVTPPRTRRNRSDSRSPARSETPPRRNGGQERGSLRRRHNGNDENSDNERRSGSVGARRRHPAPHTRDRDGTPPRRERRRRESSSESHDSSSDNRTRPSRRRYTPDSEDEHTSKKPRREAPSSPLKEKHAKVRDGSELAETSSDPAKTESVLKEKLLRQKVMNSRKSAQKHSS